MQHTPNRPPRQKAAFRTTLLALLAAILVGLLLRLCGPDSLNAGIEEYLLSPLKTMFLNALKLVVAPVVFFMISSSVAASQT